MDLKPGSRVKHYTLERQLGRGASGEVWKAYDETKTVAIKFMNENLMTSASAAKHRERLIREVEALRRLQHPNIPTLYDYDLDYVRPYLAMRYVGGDSYDRLISSGEMLKIPLERRFEMIRDIAFALTAAHEAGIIHRDIKPANMTGIENPYLLDFSISLETDEVEHTQRFVGTTLYMPADGVADRLSDNYSFAVVVYEMLFGKHPIYQLGDSIFNQFIADMRVRNRQWSFPTLIPPSQRPADLRDADLRRLDAIFERAIGSREQRYVDLREFVRDLRSAIMPQESAVEEAVAAASAPAPAAPRHLSQPPSPLPSARHVSQPPAPPAKAEPPREEEISPEESGFLDKAFLNLPAVKPPEPEVMLEQTQIEQKTVPYDYESKQRKPVEAAAPEAGTRAETPAVRSQSKSPAPEFTGPEDGTRMEMPAVRPAPPAPEFAGPEDMTMMEIRIPPAAKPPKAAVAGAEDRTMPEMPAAPAPSPADVQPGGPADAAVSTPPVPAVDNDRTVPEIPVARPAPPPVQSDSYTLMEMQAPHSSSYPVSRRQPAQENFTQLEAQGSRPPSAEDQFTLMEMQTPRSPRAQGDDFTLLEMSTGDARGGQRQKSPANNRRVLLIAALVVLLLIAAAVAFLVLSGAGTP